MRNITILFFSFLAMVWPLQAQSIYHYWPVGFHNPVLESGQFISTGSMSYSKSKLVGYTTSPSANYSMVNYLGLTEKLTACLSFSVYPRQTITITDGYRDKQKFSFNPGLTLSCRPTAKSELYGNFSYFSKTTDFGDRTYSVNEPYFDPSTGSYVYKVVKYIQPGNPDQRNTNVSAQIGFTLIGNLW
jgi:hypothetical protein